MCVLVAIAGLAVYGLATDGFEDSPPGSRKDGPHKVLEEPCDPALSSVQGAGFVVSRPRGEKDDFGHLHRMSCEGGLQLDDPPGEPLSVRADVYRDLGGSDLQAAAAAAKTYSNERQIAAQSPDELIEDLKGLGEQAFADAKEVQPGWWSVRVTAVEGNLEVLVVLASRSSSRAQLTTLGRAIAKAYINGT